MGRTGRQGESGQSYSLVTRNMAPLAADLIDLLKSTNQEIEPNLEDLAEEFKSGTMILDDVEGGDIEGDGDGEN